jgi:hypothetical protein
LSEAEALKLGISKADYEKKYRPAYAKFKSVFEKIGGKESKLKSRLKTGYGRKAKGDLNTSITKSSLTKLYEEGEKDAKEEVADEKAQLKQEGAVEDSTVPAGEIVKTQVTIEVAQNAITTTAAASLYESVNSTKVLANIPQGTSLLYDTATNNATFYNVNYGGQNGYVKKSLCRAATDAEAQKLQTTDTTRTVTVDAPVNGLGYVEPTTLAAIAGSVTAVTGLVATVAKAFGKDKAASVAETVSNTTKLAQGIATNIKQAKSETANNTNSSSTSKVASILNKGAKIADSVKQITANFVPTEQVEPTYISPAPTSIQESITNTSTQTETASRQPQTTSHSSFSVALAPATKKYLIIGGVALAGGLAVFALTRKR